MTTKSFLYKSFATLALLAVTATAAWGQKDADYYGEPLSTNVLRDVSAETVSRGNDASNEWSQTPIRNVFDGNQESYWMSSYSGDIYVDFTFRSQQTFNTIWIMQGGENDERSNDITVYTSTNGRNWNEIKSVDGLDRTIRNVSLTLDEPVTTQYVRLRLSPYSAGWTLAVNEIEFRNSTVYGTVQHKDPKWFTLMVGKNFDELGSFRHDQARFDAVMSSTTDTKLQASHTIIDTIYMHKGSSTTLTLPTQNESGTSSAQTYQRWFSYRTGRTYETNHKPCNNKYVYDLLTPTGGETAYRFENGYVGRPLGDIVDQMDFYYPTNDEFKTWFPNATSDNNWYVVACDISGYTDFYGTDFESKRSDEITIAECAEEFRTYNWFEPTLSLRAIYYIVGVDDRPAVDTDGFNYGIGRLKNPAYQGGGTAEGKRYLEEYDITFPNQHLSNYTDEIVALSKDAGSYAIPGVGSGEDASLDVSIVNDNAGLTLRNRTGNGQYSNAGTLTLSGSSRVISFAREGSPSGNSSPWTVADGSTATILVTKTYNGTTYNIARFNLTFTAASVPLTQHQVNNIQAGGDLEYRSPSWMNGYNEQGEPNLNKLTELTFDYVEGVDTYGQEEYFTFPLDWSYSSYAFFDGSPFGDFRSSANYKDPNRWYPEFSYYSIVNNYIGYGDVNGNSTNFQEGMGKDDNPGNHFIYVDASDRPGILARLPFDEKLCPGSELFVTAWMKSGGSVTNDDAGVLFTVMGVNKTVGADGSVTTKYTPIYRHASSQIRTTCHLSGGTPGTGDGTNDWYQLYFSFINNDENASSYDSYILQIENYSASTTGGDYYLDEIKVYLAQPSAQVSQKEFTCTKERTRMNIELDWERITSRLGGEGGAGINGIDFCFIDETIYNTTYKAKLEELGFTEADAPAEKINEAKTAGVNAALVNVGDGEIYDNPLVTLYYKNTFDANTQYNGDDDRSSLAINNNDGQGRYYFYKTGSENDPNGRRITVDFYSVLSPNRPYLMLIRPTDITGGTAPQIQDFVDELDEACGIKTRFHVTSTTLIKVNGEVVDPSTSFCAGEVFNFTVQMRVPRADGEEEGYDVLDGGVYFDWFFGEEREFITDHSTYGTNLDVALTNFRAVYPDATDISEATTPWGEFKTETGEVTFTENEFRLIYHYAHEATPDEGGLNAVLVLHEENLNIALLKDGLQLVVKPIQTLMPPASSGISQELWANICWSYVPLVLSADGESPSILPGFQSVAYPSDDFCPALRIGLNQIKASKSNATIRVNLREPHIVSDGVNRLDKVERGNLDRLFLVGTDDPQYSQYFGSEEGIDRTDLPIGTVETFEATVNGYANNMTIKFDLSRQSNGFQFNPREGYTYKFAAYFEERGQNTGQVYNTCQGSFVVDMKVVPKNLVWQGGADGALKNWNNDANWKRADATDLHADANSYTTNDANGTNNGFVPMLFSNVVMPEGSRAHLYMAGYVDGGAFQGKENRPEGMEAPTENIQYDLMVYDEDPDNNTGNLTTQRYRVNICNDIHFNQGAQMLHAEQLIYTKASMDVPVPTKEWTLVSTPLQGVVAGDWYTSTSTGSQAGLRLFNEVMFGSDNDRLAPAVYQRSWTGAASIIEQGGGQTPVSFGALWSSAYNDAGVPYSAGAGFSVKAADVANGSKLVFRMPKDDASYDYSSTKLDRTKAGKLLISDMANRSTPSSYDGTKDIPVTLTPSYDGNYMIVGNPFMAPLNVQDFLNANAETLEKVYWGETEHGPVVGTDSWNSDQVTGTGHSIEPYKAFFVKKLPNAASNKVTFTADMQKLTDAGMSQGTETNALVVTATGATKRSTALLAYADAAADAFAQGEDAQLITDLTGNGIDAPLAYTVAGTTAAAINVVSTARRIPMGVFAADDEVTTLSFSGTATLRNPRLYDAELQTETPLTDATTLSVSGASHGRYFIVSDGAAPTGIGGVDGDDATELSVYSVTSGEVIVAASAPIGLVNVYSAGGALLKSVDAAGAKVCTVSGLPADVVVVRVALPGGMEARKLKVKR